MIIHVSEIATKHVIERSVRKAARMIHALGYFAYSALYPMLHRNVSKHVSLSYIYMYLDTVRTHTHTYIYTYRYKRMFEKLSVNMSDTCLYRCQYMVGTHIGRYRCPFCQQICHYKCLQKCQIVGLWQDHSDGVYRPKWSDSFDFRINEDFSWWRRGSPNSHTSNDAWLSILC